MRFVHAGMAAPVVVMGDIRIAKGASVLPGLAGDMAAWLWLHVNTKFSMHGDRQRRLRDRFG